MSPKCCLELFVIQDKDTKQSFPSWACLGNLPPLSSPNPHPSWLLDSPQVHTSPPSPSLHAQGVRSLSQLISLHFYTHLKYPYLYMGLPWPSLAVSFLKTAHCVSHHIASFLKNKKCMCWPETLHGWIHKWACSQAHTYQELTEKSGRSKSTRTEEDTYFPLRATWQTQSSPCIWGPVPVTQRDQNPHVLKSHLWNTRCLHLTQVHLPLIL